MFEKKLQGTTEYLMIIGVVAILALIVLGVMGLFPAANNETNETQSRAYWLSAEPFSITEYIINSNGSIILVVRNQAGNPYTLTGIFLAGDALAVTPAEFGAGEEKALQVTGIMPESCEAGETYSYSVEINYKRSLAGETIDLSKQGEMPLVGTCA